MRGDFYKQLTNDLETARAEGLFKEERIITSAQQADITVGDGSHVINFCANNYLGLANHPELINAAKAAHVKFIAYTSLLHADRSPLGLADEHVATEKMLAESGIAYALLRNGWYTENYLASAPAALEHGVFIGAAGEGKIASATRADYAAAAARVISEDGHAGKTYELAGDAGWTLSQLAAELAKQSGKKVVYQNLSEEDFAAALKGVGLPAGLADMLARQVAAGELEIDDIPAAASHFFALLKGEPHARLMIGHPRDMDEAATERHLTGVVDLFLRGYRAARP